MRELLSAMRASAREVMKGTFCIYVMLFKMRYVSILCDDVQTSSSTQLFSVLFSYDGLPFDMTSTDPRCSTLVLMVRHEVHGHLGVG